ncbi:S9 family peptidase [Penaeicola halotolerans]|uniref:S9 family peptidase n=1 Tax=Penaeicola halotolerans TaxID=2793196 RepID=UPI001CF856A7|nr:S9 family peptidase [Penaeicola halotolerans]
MIKRKNHLLLLLGLFLLNLSALAQEKTLIKTSDLTKIVTTGGQDISNDGKWAVFVKNSIQHKSENQYNYQSHLWWVDLSTGELKQLTHGDKNDSQPAISPDGKHIAFVRSNQIWLLPIAGGEAFALTEHPNGASAPSWSPDGSQILFSSTIPMWDLEGKPTWPYERPGRKYGDEPNYKAKEKPSIKGNPDGTLEEVRAWLAENAAKNDPTVIDRLNFLGEKSLSPDLYFSHLFSIRLSDREQIQLTDGFQNYYSATWAPDGSHLLATSVKYEEHPDRTMHTDIYKINLSDKKASLFLHITNHRVGNPVYSPDGKLVLFGGQDIRESSYNQSMLGVVSAEGTNTQWITEELDRSAGSHTWSPDGQSVYFTAANQGGFTLYQYNVKTAEINETISGPVGVTDFALANDKILYTLTKVANPSELYLREIKGKKVETKQLTKFNESWLANRLIVEPTAHRYTTVEGYEIDYWVMEPAKRQEGVKYPTVLQMHGGPSAMWGPGEFSMWHEFQLMAAWGYGVVYANPRGSGGYGKNFQRGNYRNWGDGPAADVLEALDLATEQYSWIDRNQYVLTGGSYAGYLTAWIVGHDHRFKAAYAQRGVYELTFFMGEGNAWRLVPNHFGYPWEDGVKEILDYNSPQNYVQDIRTPLLIQHGSVDYRTGVRQSELLYKSLKILGKETEYVRYPDEGHELSRSGAIHRRMDRLNRIIEFFERYVKHPN